MPCSAAQSWIASICAGVGNMDGVAVWVAGAWAMATDEKQIPIRADNENWVFIWVFLILAYSAMWLWAV